MATPSRHYRLTDEDLDRIARLKEYLREEGTYATDSDVIRYALVQTLKVTGRRKVTTRKNSEDGA